METDLIWIFRIRVLRHRPDLDLSLRRKKSEPGRSFFQTPDPIEITDLKLCSVNIMYVKKVLAIFIKRLAL